MGILRRFAVPALQRVWFGPAGDVSNYPRPVLSANRGNDLVSTVLASRAPCMISRFGTQEVGCVAYYLRWRQGKALRVPYPEAIKRGMSNNAGFFPADDESLDRFAQLNIRAAGDADVMGLWFSFHGALGGQRHVISEYCRQAALVDVDSYLGMLQDRPWSGQLAGRRVLVVHPFVETIEAQYANNKTRLFLDPEVLPDFELTTLTAPQSAAGSDCGFETWFDALDDTCERIARVSYDVALIGAGAYGLPIASFVKAQGRQAVHLGGLTQLFFGIRGRRWDVDERILPLFNQYWVRPSPSERPAGASSVEGGCYW